jgi:hypothetical protein
LKITNTGTTPVHLKLGTKPAKTRWMSIDRHTATLAAGQTVTARVTMRGKVNLPGRYSAAITIADDTPDPAHTVRATMKVTKAGSRTHAVPSRHKVKRGHQLRVKATVRAPGITPTGRVVVSYHGHRVGVGRLGHGRVVINVRTNALQVGKGMLTVRFKGSDRTRPSTDRIEVFVRPRR